MSEVAQFVVVPGSDSAFTLPDPKSGLNDRHFQDIHATDLDPARSAVVMFKVTPRGQIRLRMRFNSGSEHFIDFEFDAPATTSTIPRSWHEVLAGSDLKPADNELVVSVSGSGSVLLSDIVILYHART
jgi:hypothetical protein